LRGHGAATTRGAHAASLNVPPQLLVLENSGRPRQRGIIRVDDGAKLSMST